jgi:hypothetical protein
VIVAAVSGGHRSGSANLAAAELTSAVQHNLAEAELSSTVNGVGRARLDTSARRGRAAATREVGDFTFIRAACKVWRLGGTIPFKVELPSMKP